MPLFPMFIDLNHKKCVIVGGGKVAARKAETLLDFGAAITVISPTVEASIEWLAAEGRLEICGREYRGGDLAGAFVAIAAASDRAVNSSVHEEAVRLGIPVDVADAPAQCTFTFPSLVRRGELVIGISTSGGFPALSKKLREKLENEVPEGYAQLLEVLSLNRQRILEAAAGQKMRSRLTERILEQIMSMGKYDRKTVEEFIHKTIEELTNEADD